MNVDTRSVPIKILLIIWGVITVIQIGATCVMFAYLMRGEHHTERTPAPSFMPSAEVKEHTHDSVLSFILKHEGTGIKQEPNGTVSRYGITQFSWTRFRDGQGDKTALPSSITNLTDTTQIKRFYYDYLKRFNTWNVHPVLQLIYADMAVLSGSEAVKIMQAMAGVTADGVWGPQTMDAVKRYNQRLVNARAAVLDFDKRKRLFFRHLAEHPRYARELAGWLKRADDVLAQ